jgi:NAD(P)-dependent dehydrogenase (short-subunit alcohol dehydrogenase family)
MELQAGQVAVVTGGASGIGLSLAKQFSARGIDVVIADFRADALEPAVAEVAALGGRAIGVATDVSDGRSVDQLADSTIEAFGKVNIICNNAGIVCPYGPAMWEQDPNIWRWSVDVMLLGIVNGVRSFVPKIIEAGSGHVLNTSSMAGLINLPGLTPYVAVKHAVVGMTETLALELRQRKLDIGATVLCPGYAPSGLGWTTREVAPGYIELPPVPDGAEMQAPPALLTTDDVAIEAIEAIESNRLHAIVSRGDHDPASIRRRLDSVISDLSN